MVIPIATLLSSFLLGTLVGDAFAGWIPWFGVAFGVLYFLGSFGLLRSFHEKPSEQQNA